MMNFHNIKIAEINLLNELIFTSCNLKITDLEPDAESQVYGAHRFKLNDKKIIFRVAKITPTKTGQFVSIWKRNKQGITTPFDHKDEVDFLLIVTKTPAQFGLFVFPKKVLLEHRIISNETLGGKRGMRIYPTWDSTVNPASQKTQAWQTRYFLDLSDAQNIDFIRIKNLFGVY